MLKQLLLKCTVEIPNYVGQHWTTDTLGSQAELLGKSKPELTKDYMYLGQH